MQWSYLNKYGSRSHYEANFSIYHYTYSNKNIHYESFTWLKNFVRLTFPDFPSQALFPADYC